jgi:hypothetical protein
MDLGQIAAFILIVAVFVGLVVYRTRQDRRQQQQQKNTPGR